MVLWDCHTDIVDATGIRALLLHDGMQHSNDFICTHMAWASNAYRRTTVKLQDGNSGLLYQRCQLLLASLRKTKNAAPESLLNSGDVNLNTLFREGDEKKEIRW